MGSSQDWRTHDRTVAPGRWRPHFVEKFKKALTNDFLYNRKFLNTTKLTDGLILDYIEKINRSEIKFILAYATSIYVVANFAEENCLKVKPLKSIMTSAEVLYTDMRKTIERVFQCKVFDRYGSREAGDIASECARNKYLHVSPYTHYVEILKEDGVPCKDSEKGELFVTLLTNYTMPLIRYKIGDMAIKSDEKCTCGIGFPIIKDVTGRTVDFLVNKKGDLIDGTALFPSFGLHGLYINKFQVIQESITEINVLVVLDKSKIAEFYSDIPLLENRFKYFMGEDTKINFKIVDDIEPGPSGKYRFVISKVFKKF
jgi:phenylacetate-CoA ligase